MSLSDQDLEQLREEVTRLKDELDTMTDIAEKLSKTQIIQSKSIKSSTEAMDDLSDSTNSTGKALEKQTKAVDKARMVEEARSQMLRQTAGVLDDFTNAVMSTEPGLTKYSGAVDAASESVMLSARAFGAGGPLLKAIDLVVSVFTSLFKGVLASDEAYLKSIDNLNRVGGAGYHTSESLKNLALQSSITYHNIEWLTGPLKNLGTGVLTLGDTVGDGQKAFMGLTSVLSENGDAELQRFRRMGITQDELIEDMADFVKLQSLSATNIKLRFKDEAALQKASLNYVQNLRELSALTGKEVDDIKRSQQDAANQAQLQLRRMQMQEEAARLDEMGLEDQAAQIRKRIENEEDLMHKISALGDPAMTAAFTEFLATGGQVISEVGAVLPRLGINLTELNGMLDSVDADAGVKTMGLVFDKINEAALGPIGEVGRYSEEVRNIFGLSKEMLEIVAIWAKSSGTPEEKLKEIEKRLNELGQTTADGAREAQVALEQSGRDLRKTMQGFVEAVDGPVQTALQSLAEAASYAAKKLNSILNWFGEDTEYDIQEDISEYTAKLQDLIENNASSSAIHSAKWQRANSIMELLAMNPDASRNLSSDELVESIEVLSGSLQRTHKDSEKYKITEAKIATLIDILREQSEYKLKSNTAEEISTPEVELPTSNSNTPATPDPNSILDNTSSPATTETNQRSLGETNQTSNLSTDLLAMHRESKEMHELLESRLNEMIRKLEESNDIQTNIYRHGLMS